MTTSRTDELLEILQHHFKPQEEGWMWMAFYADDSDGGVVNEITGEYEDPIVAADGLAHIMNEIDPDRVLLALCRSDARPTEADRRLWRRLRGLVDATKLADMVMFNRRAQWSMRAEDAAATKPA